MKKIKLDDYEKDIIEKYEKGEFKPLPKKKKNEAKKKLQEAAKNTLKKDRNISIRISQKDLLKIKSKAEDSGIPYQTLIGSVLHRFAEGKIKLEI